jgi:hypothetical protein
MYVCCNIYTHPTKKEKQYIYKNHWIRLDTDMRLREEGYKLTTRIILGEVPARFRKDFGL